MAESAMPKVYFQQGEVAVVASLHPAAVAPSRTIEIKGNQSTATQHTDLLDLQASTYFSTNELDLSPAYVTKSSGPIHRELRAQNRRCGALTHVV